MAENKDSSNTQIAATNSDNRELWDWDSRFPAKAKQEIFIEVIILLVMLLISLFGAGIFLGFSGQELHLPSNKLDFVVNFKFLAIFFIGWLGGVTFSIKWLIHATAKGKWHLDRRNWRLLVPLLGGVYSCVVMTLFTNGFMSAGQAPNANGQGIAALSFLVGYFSDGVSGLLTNIANAVFGTVEKK